MKKIVVLFGDVGTNLSYIIKNLHQNELVVVAAVTYNPQASGIRFAKEADIPAEIIDPEIFDTREEFDARLVEVIRSYDPDLTVLAGFMRILTPVFTYQIRAINLHPSLLPRHKGLNAIERSFYDADPDGGVSVHWVNSELDGGEMILQRSIDKEGLSFEAYREKVKTVEKELLADAIRQVLKRE